MHSGVNCEFEIGERGSQLCLHGAMCQNALTHGTVCLDSLETTANSTLMSGPVSYVSMEVYMWMEEPITTVTAQIVDLGDNCENLMPLCWSKPCHNDATHEDTVDSFFGHSWPGYTGTQCEMGISECSSNL